MSGHLTGVPIDKARQSIISDAENMLDAPNTVASESESSKFEAANDRKLAAALYIIVMNGLQDEFGWHASTDAPLDRVDRWLTAQTDHGFFMVFEFVDAAEAAHRLAKLSEERDEENDD